MSREHAPAVKELAARLVSQLIRYGIVPAIDRPAATLVAADSIAEGLAPLLRKAEECCIGIVTQSEMRNLRIELARWEPPKTEGK